MTKNMHYRDKSKVGVIFMFESIILIDLYLLYRSVWPNSFVSH